MQPENFHNINFNSNNSNFNSNLTSDSNNNNSSNNTNMNNIYKNNNITKDKSDVVSQNSIDNFKVSSDENETAAINKSNEELNTTNANYNNINSLSETKNIGEQHQSHEIIEESKDEANVNNVVKPRNILIPHPLPHDIINEGKAKSIFNLFRSLLTHHVLFRSFSKQAAQRILDVQCNERQRALQYDVR